MRIQLKWCGYIYVNPSDFNNELYALGVIQYITRYFMMKSTIPAYITDCTLTPCTPKKKYEIL